MAKYFKDYEFLQCSPPCDVSQVSPGSLDRLDKARAFAGIPFIVNSAYRSSEYEKKKGRSGSGAHTRGCAFDIRCTDSRSRFLIVMSAIEAGFTRIGIAKTFVHLDDDASLSHPCIWLY